LDYEKEGKKKKYLQHEKKGSTKKHSADVRGNHKRGKLIAIKTVDSKGGRRAVIDNETGQRAPSAQEKKGTEEQFLGRKNWARKGKSG